MTAVLPEQLIVTEPGVYDMAEDDYFGDPVPSGSLSSSGAKLLLPPSCPAKFRWAQDHPREPKREFDLGHAAHKLALGAGAALELIDAANYKTDAAKAAKAAAYEAGKTPVLPHEMEQAQAMADAIHRHPDAGALFHPDLGKAEQSLFWVDEPSGVWCRSRLDFLPAKVHGYPLIIPDLKTAASAAPDDVERVVNNFRYHLQAAFYTAAVKACGIDDSPAFVFVFVEKAPPYLIHIVQPDREYMRMGRELFRKAIDIYRRCTEADQWPGYSNGIQFVSPPPWAIRQHEEHL